MGLGKQRLNLTWGDLCSRGWARYWSGTSIRYLFDVYRVCSTEIAEKL